MSGRRGMAPCGHEGEHIFANYVQCLVGCDKIRKEAARSPEGPVTPGLQKWFRDLDYHFLHHQTILVLVSVWQGTPPASYQDALDPTQYDLVQTWSAAPLTKAKIVDECIHLELTLDEKFFHRAALLSFLRVQHAHSGKTMFQHVFKGGPIPTAPGTSMQGIWPIVLDGTLPH